MKIIHTVLQSDLLLEQPPVLIDIGASGEINARWKEIAPYSICIAFDADDREFHITEQTNKSYKKLITFNRIVTATPEGQANFYLTSSPFCSSLLEPDTEKLKPWIFSELFKIEKISQLPAITIESALQQANITYIDWFKTDTQGTDLRLFMSLPDQLKTGILAAELEPGILDAYKEEDKLFSVMREMQKAGLWLSSMTVKGTQRLSSDYAGNFGAFISKRLIRTTPGWAEVTYLRNNASSLAPREILLLYIFALIEKQYGFALEIIDLAMQHHSLPLFRECRSAVLKKMMSSRMNIPFVILKRQINKLLSKIHD